MPSAAGARVWVTTVVEVTTVTRPRCSAIANSSSPRTPANAIAHRAGPVAAGDRTPPGGGVRDESPNRSRVGQHPGADAAGAVHQPGEAAECPRVAAGALAPARDGRGSDADDDDTQEQSQPSGEGHL